jgi:two-component system sensor histidine kinase UhpB
MRTVLLMSAGLAGVAAVSVWGLVARLRRALAREAERARDLQDLSARLITALEEDRRSIARELHDEVGQAIGAIKAELIVAARVVPAGPGAVALHDARAIAEGALSAVRDLSQLLRPSVLEDLGLIESIHGLIGGFSRRHEIRAEFHHPGLEGRLPPAIEVAVYRIVQEALTNVGRHARATTCRVTLERSSSGVRLTVVDDGIGCAPAEPSPNGARQKLGLVGIRERAVSLGGDARFRAAPGRGAELVVEIPARVPRRRPPAPGRNAPVSGRAEAVLGDV